MIREIAENPNVHQRLSPGRELYLDPAARFAVHFSLGSGVHSATVQRVRLAAGDVPAAVAEIRDLLRSKGRAGAEWELGESCTPAGLVAQLGALGVAPDTDEPVAIGMRLDAASIGAAPAGTAVRRVGSVDELILAREIQAEAFGDVSEAADLDVARADFEEEGVSGSTFLASLDGRPVAAAYASYTPHGLILFGGATLPAARGRGAYRALVAARAREAEARGTPVLVTHAGRMSLPILERLGFARICRIDRLVDVL